MTTYADTRPVRTPAGVVLPPLFDPNAPPPTRQQRRYVERQLRKRIAAALRRKK